MEYIDRRKEQIQRAIRQERDQEHWNEVHEQLLAIQKKSLEVSAPDDADEKEADAVSAKVMSGESAHIHGTGGTINRKGEGSFETSPEFNSKLESSKGGGQSLDDSTQREMESGMNADFSDVKIHTGSEANAMNESVNAKAFTHGQDIYFGEGNYNAESEDGKSLLAHELVHTVQQGKGVSRKINRSPLSPKNFAARHFKGVAGYSWKNLRQYLGSDGSKEGDENLEILLNALINQNPELKPNALWVQISTDPSQLKGFNSASMYLSGADKLPTYTRTAETLKTEDAADAGLQDLQNGTIEYTRRRHFIFGKKKKEAKRKAASEKSTAFVQQSANQLDAIVTNVNDSKHVLESDLQNLSAGLNQQMVADAQVKEQLTFGRIGEIRTNGQLAKLDMLKYYYGSATVINNNTETQLKKLETHMELTIEKLNLLKENQTGEIKNLYDAFNASVMEIAGDLSNQAIQKGGARYAEIQNRKSNDSPLLKTGKQRYVVRESQIASSEINTLADKTIQDAKGIEETTMTMPWATQADFEADMNLGEAVNDVTQTYYNTVDLLNQRAETDKQNALNLMYSYYDKIDAQAIQIIDTLTTSLQLYYDKLNAFGTLQDEAINAFYSKSVSDLNVASEDLIGQSKTRLETFKNSQQGLKTPRKKKLQEQIDLAQADINPLIAQANTNVQATNDERAVALAALKLEVQTGFDSLAAQGATDMENQMLSSAAALEATRQKGIEEQLDLRVVHLRQIIRDVKGGKRQMDQSVTDLIKVNEEQLITLDTDLTAQLESFKTQASNIVADLDRRMDYAEHQAVVDEITGDLQREQNIIDFEKAKMLLTGTEDCYRLYSKYKALTHQHKRGLTGKNIKKQLETLLKAHGLEPTYEAYASLVSSFRSGFRLVVSATALEMVQVFDDKLELAKKDYSNIENVNKLFDELGPLRKTTTETLKYQEIANKYAAISQGPVSPVTGRREGGRRLTMEEQSEYDYAYAKVDEANTLTAPAQLAPIVAKYPIFDDASMLPKYRTPKIEIVTAKTPHDLQILLLNYINERQADVKKSRERIKSEEGSTDVYSMDKVVSRVMTQYRIAEGTVQNTIIQNDISMYRTNQIALAILMAIISIALIIITAGAATPAVIAGFAAVGMLAIDVYYVMDAVDEYQRNSAFAGSGLLSSDPSMIWIFLAVAGAVLDAAAIFKALKAVQVPARELSATGDVFTFEQAVAKATQLGEMDAKLADSIIKAARMRTGYNAAAKNFYRITANRLYTGIDPAAVAEMVKMAYYSIREGMTSFDQFLIVIKQAYVKKNFLTSMADNFTPEELAAIKKAWQEAAGGVEKGIVNTGKIVVKTLNEAVTTVDNLMEPQIRVLNVIYPDAKMGYRGSLATGKKYAGGPFDPTDWDVDAFIVSDELAKKFNTTFRNGREIPEIKHLADELERSFKGVSGYRIEVTKPFTFRIWTQNEFDKIVKQNGYKLFQ